MTRDIKQSELYEAHYHFKERRSSARFFAILLLVLLFFFGVRAYWVENFSAVRVDGSSMYKTLRDGERLLMRTVKDGKGLERGDIIVVRVEHYEELIEYNKDKAEPYQTRFLIKRLIAVEGDVVRCKDGQVEIQYGGKGEFTPLDEPYARYYLGKDNYDFGEYVVGEGEIFFLGDNRQDSVDSRYGIENGSHLNDRLYKAVDVWGKVPSWAVKYRETFEGYFKITDYIQKVKTKLFGQ